MKKSQTSRFTQSLHELQQVRAVTFCGIMGALAIVLKFVATIEIGQYIRIGFSNLPNVVVDFLFGPFTGAVFAGIMDIVKYMIRPAGAFFPGFTVSAAVGALIYGSFLYKRKPTLSRVLLADLCVKGLVNIGLNTLWLTMLYSRGFLAILPARIISNTVMLPIDTVIVFFTLNLTQKSCKIVFQGAKP